MSRLYTGKYALRYNQRWRAYNERTLAEALTMIDLAALRTQATCTACPPRVLDVACGTGLLLKRLVELVPGIDIYGIDVSADMLLQARLALPKVSSTHFKQAQWGSGETVGLPYAPQTFDLITCTNTLHYLPDPIPALKGLHHLLAPTGSLVLEDYARRPLPFPWPLLEWLLRRIEGEYVRAYTLAEAQSLCVQAGFEVVASKAFVIDWLCHGWVLRLR
jgi:ubiquinone/menaquinone biosynthesis C-methylase UbiE